MKKTKKEETYIITPIGLLEQETIDKLTLYMYRTGYNCIILVDGELNWGTVKRITKKKK